MIAAALLALQLGFTLPASAPVRLPGRCPSALPIRDDFHYFDLQLSRPDPQDTPRCRRAARFRRAVKALFEVDD